MGTQTYNPLKLIGQGVGTSLNAAKTAAVAIVTAPFKLIGILSDTASAKDASLGLRDPERFHFFGTAHSNFGNLKVRAIEGAQSLAGTVSDKVPFKDALWNAERSAMKLRKVEGSKNALAAFGHVSANMVMAPIYGIAKFAKRMPIIFAATTAYAGYKLVKSVKENRDQNELNKLQQENSNLEGQIGQLANLRGAPQEMYNPLAEGKSAQHFQDMVASSQSQQLGR